MITLGDKLYHIDEPNGVYEIVKSSSSFHYAVYFHPSFGKLKTLREDDIGSTFFLTKEECLDARIERAKRHLELEIHCKERKL